MTKPKSAVCPMCGGRMRLRRIAYVDDGVEYGRFEAFVCGECLESFFTEEASLAIEEKARSLGTWGVDRRTNLASSGRSLVVRIPAEFVRRLGLSKGQPVVIRPVGKRTLEIEIA